ncbi:MAG: DUF99 family protein [Thermoplasmatales archaeon]
MDQNSLFNKDTRVLALDDSPFSRGDEFTSIVGVIIRKDLYIESIMKMTIKVDGLDATEKILEAIKEKGSGVRVIMTQGVTLGGFNILNVKRLYAETGIPIINVVDHEPNMKEIKEALRKYFQDWRIRYSALLGDFHKFGSLYIQATGITPKTAHKFLDLMTVNGKIPEPLRITDLIAGII